MKKIGSRSIAVLALTLMLVIGLCIYIARYISDGRDWVAFPVNTHLYTNAQAKRGEIYDVKREPLLTVDNGKRSYSEDKTVRLATLHAVGDKSGNIATGAQTKFSYLLSGYSLIDGAFALSDEGNDLFLTIDSKVCAEAYNALDGQNGTIAVCNYKTGDILCMVSAPTFDAESVPLDILTNKKYEAAYVNKFISASYVPGSVYKLVTTIAALEQIDDIENFSYNCTGTSIVADEKVVCSSVHGGQNLEEALCNSCNCAYGELAVQLGEATLEKYARKLGLEESITFNGISTAGGNVDVSGSDWDLAWSGIGQSRNLVCPANMLTFVSAIANGGKYEQLNLVSRVTLPSGIERLGSYRKSGKRLMSTKIAERTGELMRNNVLNGYGESRFAGMELCAKSGTAETGDGTSHSWFVGFSQREDFPVAFVAIIEHGGSGSKVAGTAVSKVLKSAAASMGVTLG